LGRPDAVPRAERRSLRHRECPARHSRRRKVMTGTGAARVVSPSSSGRSRVLAGIAVPDTPAIARALDRARAESDAYLFHHAVRSWLFAARSAQLSSVDHDGEVLAVGTLLHDLTLTKDFKGPRRFEVEAADIARAFAREQGFDDRRAQLVWDSVALN